MSVRIKNLIRTSTDDEEHQRLDMASGRPYLLRIDSTTPSELMITFSMSPEPAPARILPRDAAGQADKQKLHESKVGEVEYYRSSNQDDNSLKEGSLFIFIFGPQSLNSCSLPACTWMNSSGATPSNANHV